MSDSKNHSNDVTDDQVVVTFNGRTTALNKRLREEVAATDQDRMRDWRESEETEKGQDNSLDGEEDRPIDPHSEDKEPVSFDRDVFSTSLEDREAFLTPYSSSYRPSHLNSKTSKRKKDDVGLFIKRFWLPFLSAIIVGLGFGFTVLVLFTQHTRLPDVTTVSATTTPSSSPTASVDQSVADVTVTVDGKDYALNLYVLQLNVYSTKQNAETAQAQFTSQGIHSVVIQDQGNYALFAGLALSKDNLQPIKTALTSQVETYGKNWVISDSKLKGKKRDLQDLKTANLIIQNLIPISLQVLQGAAADQSVLTEVNKALQQMEDPSTGSAPKDLGTLKGTLLVAYHALSQSEPNGKDAQKALLDAVGYYQTLLNSFQSH